MGSREDVRAVLIAGSVATGEARPDSDVDVILLTTECSQYIDDVSWAAALGTVRTVAIEDYGRVTAVRVFYEDGLEVEYGIAPADWASAPFDIGTEQVARDGIFVLFDRDGHATALATTFSSPNE